SDTTVCPECGATIPAGGKALEEHIAAATTAVGLARRLLDELPAIPDLPPKPAADPWKISEQLTEAKGLAAGAGALEEARRILAEAEEAIAAATRDADAAEAAGKKARAELDAATAKVEAIDIAGLEALDGKI